MDLFSHSGFCLDPLDSLWESQRTGWTASCLGHLISLSWGVSQEALTRLSKLYTSAPPPFVKGGDSLALSLRQGYYEGEIGQVFIKLKNLWTPETTFVNPSVSCHIDNRS